MRVESHRPVGDGWFHGGPGPRDNWRDRLVRPTPIVIVPKRLDATTLDAVLRARAALSGLTDRHRRHLQGRGFTDESIAANGNASFVDRTQQRLVAARLLDQFGAQVMEQVPGFFWRTERNGQRYPAFHGWPGILIPVRNACDQWHGFQIRLDDATADGNRYLWSSSLDKPGGTGSGAPLHVARPPGEALADLVLLTEGPLKAYRLAAELGLVVIALPGVSTQKGLATMVTTLGATRVRIAFDQDADTNTRVLRKRDEAAALLAALGCTVELVTWETHPGPNGTPTPKGVDDAIQAGVPLDVVPYPFPHHSGRIEPIPAEAMPKSAPRPVRHINEARAELGFAFEGALADLGSRRPQGVQVCAATGVGKTRLITDMLAAWDEDGWPTKPSRARGAVPMAEPLRVIILGVTTEACKELEAALPPGLAIRQEGRNSDPTHRWGCLEPERTHSAGASRHNPRADVCSTCMEINGWAKGHPECGYLRSKHAVEHARVVIAPASSYFNGSTGLDAFDLIVFDEGLFPFLVEEITVTAERCAQWRTRMNQIDAERPRVAGATPPPRYPVGSPFRQLVDALDMLQEHRPGGPQEWIPAMPRLREVCPDLAAIVRAVRTINPAKGSDRYPCETPHLWEDREQRLVPLRALRDIADAVHDELSRDEHADTRLWLTASGFVVLRPRQDLLDSLRRRKVVNLDATPHDALRFFLPNTQVINVDAPAHQRIVQITDFLGTPRELAGIGNANLSRLQAAVNHIFTTETPASSVIFGRKSIMPGGAEPGALTITADYPGVQYGWFDNHTRGLNKYQDADLLVIIGRHSPPIDRIRAEVMAARFSPDPAPKGDHLELLRYDWRDPEGNGKGRFTTADDDPDVNAAIRQAERASILQAIGRGRGVNRSPDDPLLIYLLSSLPISGLPIDTLTTLEDLGGGPRRRGENQAFRQQSAMVRAESAHSNAETRTKVAIAISAMKADGSTITGKALAERAGVCRDTLYADEACRSMLDQARGRERITLSVGAGTDNTYSLSHPAPTLKVIHQEPPRRAPAERMFRPHPPRVNPLAQSPPDALLRSPRAYLVAGE